MDVKLLKDHRSFDGQTRFWEHTSSETKTKMKFSTFTPPGEIKGCVIWLSGLTCTDENFITKAGAQRALAKHGLMVICPDTSPRGLNLPAEHDSYDFGSGAGFYVDSRTEGYKDHYRMYSYIANELFEIVTTQFPVPKTKVSIMGHSMGGHGALVLGLREPAKFRSVSAFAPIAHPVNCQWGQKAFAGYLGEDRTAWAAYDATELVKSGRRHPRAILVDQGLKDEFLEKQLLPDDLALACKQAGQALEIHYREGYDHSYYFISTFIESHVAFHAAALEA